MLEETAKYHDDAEFKIFPMHLTNDRKSGLYIFLLPQHHMRQPYLFYLYFDGTVTVPDDFTEQTYNEKVKAIISDYSGNFKSKEIKKIKSYFKLKA